MARPTNSFSILIFPPPSRSLSLAFSPFARSMSFSLQAFHSLLSTSLIYPLSTSTTATSTLSTSGMDFVRHRCAAPAFDLVEFFRGEGGKGVMTQLSGWGRKWDV